MMRQCGEFGIQNAPHGPTRACLQSITCVHEQARAGRGRHACWPSRGGMSLRPRTLAYVRKQQFRVRCAGVVVSMEAPLLVLQAGRLSA
jgi:hypothetical protein